MRLHNQKIIFCMLILCGLCRISGAAIEVEGIYLMHGIYDCLEINKSDDGGYETDAIWDVEYKNGTLHLTDNVNTVGQEYTLIPSETIAGDWDLIEKNVVSDLPDRNTEEAISVSSILHKVNDPLVPAYYEIDREHYVPDDFPRSKPLMKPIVSKEKLIMTAETLIERYPGDLWVRLLYFDALLRAGEIDQLESELEKWGDEFERCANPDIRAQFEECRYAVEAHRLSAAGENAYEFVELLFSPDMDLQDQIEAFPQILNYRQYATPIDGLVYRSTENYLGQMLMNKTYQMQAIFMLLQGKRSEALELLASCYHLAQLITENQPLVGTLIMHVALDGLELYALNGCESAPEIRQCREMFDWLYRQGRRPDFQRLERIDYPEEIFPTRKQKMSYGVALARLQCLRLALAARLFLVENGRLPESIGDLGDYFPEKMPLDPFTDEHLKIIRKDESCAIYSIGPDGTDDHAAIQYKNQKFFFWDESNINGDIVVEVKEIRHYPFPAKPVTADTADDLRRQFPSGLPQDIYARTGTPLGIADSHPLKIYSIGPDRDQEDNVPEMLYDPTNGLTSNGDLYIEIPPK